MPCPDAEVTALLRAWRADDAPARERLLALVYEDLRRIAHARLCGEREGHTLDTRALVHEAYLRLVDVEQVEWADRAHFLALAARLMRRVLVDYAHARNAGKRGGGQAPAPLDEARLVADERVGEVLDLDDALARLEKSNRRAAEALALRYFGGLVTDEIAGALGVSVATAERDLRFGRAWLAREWKSDG